jgi:hypothetical protein
MHKTSLSLLVAGVMAVAGVAQAQTFDSPTRAGEASTMTMGQPNQNTTNSPYGDHGMVIVDTTVLGAAPVAVYSYGAPHFIQHRDTRHQAAATFNVPARAGEASTMTGGAPNMLTDNQHLRTHGGYITGYDYSSPYSAPGAPYYGS